MLGVLKSIQSVFASILSGVPDSLRVVLDFIWKCRWFIVGGWVAFSLYTMAMKVLPFLMWSWVIKSIVGSIFSLSSL